MSSDEDVDMKTGKSVDSDALINQITEGLDVQEHINTFINDSTGEVPSDLLDFLTNEAEDEAEEEAVAGEKTSYSSPPRGNIMSKEKRMTGSNTAMKHIKSKLMGYLQREFGENTSSKNFEEQFNTFIDEIANGLTSSDNNIPSVKDTNNAIRDFLGEKLGVFVKLRDTRGCITLNIGDAQQMIDIWGTTVTEYAKSGDSKCYLCGLPIYPHASCPEMEHKYDVVTAYTTMHHYRTLNIYKGNETQSIYTLWKNFVKNVKLILFYGLINNNNDYKDSDVDTEYHRIFGEFIRFIGKPEDNKLVRYDKDNELVLTDIGEYAYYLIKAWLLEFAYSHHTCNQAKSNTHIWENEDYMNEFIKRAANMSKPNKASNDSKMKKESVFSQGKLGHALKSREDRTNDMFNHLQATIDKYRFHYGNISTTISKIGDSYDKKISMVNALVMMKALYYIVKNADSENSEIQNKRQNQTQQRDKIKELYKLSRQIESKIIAIDSYNSYSERLKTKSNLQKQQLETELSSIKTELSELNTGIESEIEELPNSKRKDIKEKSNSDVKGQEKDTSDIPDEEGERTRAIDNMDKVNKILNDYETDYNENPIRDFVFDCDYYPQEETEGFKEDGEEGYKTEGGRKRLTKKKRKNEDKSKKVKRVTKRKRRTKRKNK